MFLALVLALPLTRRQASACAQATTTHLPASRNAVQGSKSAAEYRRTLQQRVNDPVILLFGRAGNGAGQALQQGQASFLQHPQGLPGNVHLLTLKDNGDGQILLRLAHLYQVCCSLLPAPPCCCSMPAPNSVDLIRRQCKALCKVFILSCNVWDADFSLGCRV